MEHKDRCNPPCSPHAPSLQTVGLLGHYQTKHTLAPPNSLTGVAQDPLLCRQRLKMREADSFIPEPASLLHIPHFHPLLPSF